jgi:hypothetical protein
MRVCLATEPGSPGTPNEDHVVSTPDLVVVLDGVTVPASMDTGCRHETSWYVRHLGAALLRAAIHPDVSLAVALATAISEVAAIHAHTCDLAQLGAPSAAVAVLRERDAAVDYLVLADCTIILAGPSTTEAITDDRVERVASSEDDAFRHLEAGSPAHNRRAADLIAAQRRRRNRHGGYWVAAATPEAAQHAITGTRPRSALCRAAVLTDGAAHLVSRYGVLDWKGVIDILEAHGPIELLRRVRHAEETDPQGARWPRFKRSDDATAAFCQIGGETAGA